MQNFCRFVSTDKFTGNFFDLTKLGFNWHELTNWQLINFVGLTVPTNSLTNFDLIKREFNWHELTNWQLTNFVGLSVPTNSLTNFDLIKREFNWHEPTWTVKGPVREKWMYTCMMLQARYEFNNLIFIQYHVHAFHIIFWTKSNVRPPW